MDEKIFDLIEKDLKILDYEPRLNIRKVGTPINVWIKVVLETKKSPLPTHYVINTKRSCRGMKDPVIFSAMEAAKAVYRRRQLEEERIETFFDREDGMSTEFFKAINLLAVCALSRDEASAEIVAMIAGTMRKNHWPVKMIARMVKMDASEIKERYGRELIEDSVLIAI